MIKIGEILLDECGECLCCEQGKIKRYVTKIFNWLFARRSSPIKFIYHVNDFRERRFFVKGHSPITGEGVEKSMMFVPDKLIVDYVAFNNEQREGCVRRKLLRKEAVRRIILLQKELHRASSDNLKKEGKTLKNEKGD